MCKLHLLVRVASKSSSDSNLTSTVAVLYVPLLKATVVCVRDDTQTTGRRELYGDVK